MIVTTLRSPVEHVTDYDAWLDAAMAAGWSDGLPLAMPTEARVLALIDASERAADDVIGVIAPTMGVATVEQVAIQAAMAGCLPEHLPVVLAALDAMLDPNFNLHGVQSTSNPCVPLVVVSGPIVERLGFNAGEGAFSGGSRANAAVGRAVRLVMWNIGGGVIGETDMATVGQPAKYSFCTAEQHGDTTPWPDFHTTRGFSAEDSCVTVFACSSPEPIFCPGDAERILRVLATTLPTTGVNMFHAAGEYMVTFGLRPAQQLAAAGYSRADVQRWLYEHARYDLGELRRSGVMLGESHTDYWGSAVDGPLLASLSDDARLPMVHRPEDIHVIVSGGPTQWWAGFLPGWGDYGGQAITRRIDGPTAG